MFLCVLVSLCETFVNNPHQTLQICNIAKILSTRRDRKEAPRHMAIQRLKLDNKIYFYYFPALLFNSLMSNMQAEAGSDYLVTH